MMLEDIAAYLQSKGVGTLGTDIRISSEPSSPDTCITLYEYSGQPPDLLAELEFPGLQVRSRGKSWSIARTALRNVQSQLQKIGNEFSDESPEGITINGTYYAAVFTAGGITPLGEDSNGRVLIVQNYTVMKGE